VFNEGGFDCVLGNPPFLGGQSISGIYGNDYLNAIKINYDVTGSCDLVTYFFRRIFQVIKINGFQALISTNTISQGVARENGLDIIISNKGNIIFTIRSARWPGIAAVFVTLISITKGEWNKNRIIDNRIVLQINSFLDDTKGIQSAEVLKVNENLSFMGSTLLGMGFTMTFEEANEMLINNQEYKEVLYPFLSGENFNNHPMQKADRWVINFWNFPLQRINKIEWDVLSDEDKKKMLKNGFVSPEYRGSVAADFPLCLKIIENKVKPEREKQKDLIAKEKWWLYTRPRIELYEKIKPLKRVLLVAQTSKTLAFEFVELNTVYAIGTICFAYDKALFLALLQSNFHSVWAWKYGSTMKTDLRYAPTDIFETFPFPQNYRPLQEQKLETIGETYNEHRRQLMLGMQLGLTKTYNLFHVQFLTSYDIEVISKQSKEVAKQAQLDIFKLRELHMQMDEAVLDAYGWSDIQLKHDFYEVDYLPENDRVRYTIHPDARKEILKRLLALNHKIYEEEIYKGLHKEADVKKFFEQKGIPVPQEVLLKMAEVKKAKKLKVAKKIKKKGDAVNDGESVYKQPGLFEDRNLFSGG
jgi:hypothetical protein